MYEKSIPETPGSQPDWISIYPTSGAIATYPLSRHEQILDLGDLLPRASYLYVDSRVFCVAGAYQRRSRILG